MIPEERLSELDELAERYWWHRHRAAAVVQAAERFSPRPLAGRYLDVGCGPGASTRRIWEALVKVGVADSSAPPPLGVDSDERARSFCAKNGVEFQRLDLARGLGGLSEAGFGFATALDVVERLPDPEPVVASLAQRLAPGALCVFTAPAFPQLASDWELAMESRRYRLEELAALCRAGGLLVLWSSYLFSYGFLSGFARRRAGPRPPRRPGRAVSAAMEAVSALERRALKLFPLPLGTSAMVVAARPPLS